MLLRSLRLAWLSLVRQPARASLGILGVAAVGALLFDMLLLSRGLVLSFGDLLDRVGFDVRVLAADAPPFTGARVENAGELAARIESLPEVEAVVRLRIRDAEVALDSGVGPRTSDNGPRTSDYGQRRSESARRVTVSFIGSGAAARSLWTVVEGEDLPRDTGRGSRVVVNRGAASRLNLRPGSTLVLRGRCDAGLEALLPVTMSVVGIADFPYDTAGAITVAGSLEDAARLCGSPDDRADMLMVRSSPGAGAEAAAAAIRRINPDLNVLTNDDILERFSRVEFSYFRQISAVLATVTLFFGFLLIAVLLTVSVNQRLGEIAALRAVGLSRHRVVTGVLFESIILVGAGGILAVPLGLALSVWLDGILRAMPGIPVDLRFFVFEPRVLVIHAGLLSAAAIAAAAYPMRIVAALPIAATLRREVIS